MNVLFAVESFAWDSYSLIGAMSFLLRCEKNMMSKMLKSEMLILQYAGLVFVAETTKKCGDNCHAEQEQH